MEDILINSDKRFVLFPIKHEDIWLMYKKQVASFWTTEEIDLINDLRDWEKLSQDEQKYIKNVLAFFAASDGIIVENLAQKFCNEVQYPEARAFYSFQSAMEQIHSETYSLLIDTYIKSSEEKDHLFNAINNIPIIRKKADWALKWINDNNLFSERLIGFIIVEGLFFSASFCAIYWLKKRGLMPGLTFSNELISRDEGLHCNFGLLLYYKLNNKLSTEKIYNIIKEAIEIEKEFVTDSLPVELIGMNSKLMIQYIEFIADRLLKQLGYDKLYNVLNPFEWMDMISLQGKTNFFEKRVGEYQKANIMNNNNNNKNEFKIDEDF